MRDSFYGLVTRDEEYMNDLYAADSSEDLPAGNLSHVFHCYDYLRQTILCRSDTTIEWRSRVNPLHIDGYGPPRTCRNWVSTRPSWISRVSSDDSTGRGVKMDDRKFTSWWCLSVSMEVMDLVSTLTSSRGWNVLFPVQIDLMSRNGLPLAMKD